MGPAVERPLVQIVPGAAREDGAPEAPEDRRPGRHGGLRAPDARVAQPFPVGVRVALAEPDDESGIETAAPIEAVDDGDTIPNESLEDELEDGEDEGDDADDADDGEE